MKNGNFWRGVNWFFTNLNEDGLIYAEFQNEKPSKLHYESIMLHTLSCRLSSELDRSRARLQKFLLMNNF